MTSKQELQKSWVLEETGRRLGALAQNWLHVLALRGEQPQLNGHTPLHGFLIVSFPCAPAPTSVGAPHRTETRLNSHSFLQLCLGRDWADPDLDSSPCEQNVRHFRSVLKTFVPVQTPSPQVTPARVWRRPFCNCFTILGMMTCSLLEAWVSLAFEGLCIPCSFPAFLKLPALTRFLLPLASRIFLNLTFL